MPFVDSSVSRPIASVGSLKTLGVHVFDDDLTSYSN